jgi:hypothetical protein
VAATDESPMTAEVRQLCACLRSSAGTASATATATAAAAAASALTAATAAAADDSFELGFAQLRLAVAEDEACVQQLRAGSAEAAGRHYALHALPPPHLLLNALQPHHQPREPPSKV